MRGFPQFRRHHQTANASNATQTRTFSRLLHLALLFLYVVMWVMSAIQAFRPKALRPKALLLAVPLGALGTLGAVWMSKKIGGETSPGFDVVKEGEHDEFEWVDSLATTPSVRSPNRRSIVFVHGLNPLGSTTHARDTWTANVMGKKVFWPEELLPISVPNARVLVLHYNSSISWNSGIADLEDHATLLMRWLKLKRKVRHYSILVDTR